MSERFEHHARLMSVLTLASRALGLVRDASLARIFGIGPLMDAFNFAFVLPNLFRRLFGEGAISGAFTPRYAEVVRDAPGAARPFASRLLRILARILWALVATGEAILLLLWLSSADADARFAYELAAIMLPFMPLVCLTAVAGAALQVHGRFGPTAASPIVLNGALIAATLGLWPLVRAGSIDPATHLRAVSAAVVVAGVLQWLWASRVLARVAPAESVDPTTGGGADAARVAVGGTFRDALPMMLGLGVLQLNTFLDNLVASWPTVVGPTVLGFDYPLSEGAMSALANAQRLYEFPLGVFGIAIATAIFPVLARLSNDPAAFAGAVRRGLRLSMFVGLPASAGLLVLAPEAVGTLFRGGAFGEEDVARVARILAGYAPAIWSYQLVHIYTRAFYARREARTPVRVSLAVVGLNLVLNVALICTPLREAGLAWSTAICSVVQCVVLATLLRRRLPGAFGPDVLASWARTLTATAAMTGVVVATMTALPDGERWRDDAWRLACGVAAGALAFGAAAWALGMTELRELRHRGRADAA